MKGLLIKDMYNLRQNIKTQLLTLVFLGFISFYMKSPSYLISVILMMSINYYLLCFSYDEKNDFYSYALSLPISRRDLVLARYLSGYIIVGLMTGLVLVLNRFLILSYMDISPGESYMVIFSLVGVLSFFISFLSPLIFKNGVEKSRVYIFVLVFFPLLLIGFLRPRLGAISQADLVNFFKFILPLVLIGLNFISLRLSLGIMEKKDF